MSFNLGPPPVRRARRVKGPAKAPDGAPVDKATRQKLTLADVAEDKPELAAFIKAREQMQARTADKSDMRFWVCLVFQSEKQKKQFLKTIGERKVPVLYEQYADGEQFASAVGVEVEPNVMGPMQSPLHKKLTQLVKEEQIEAANVQKIKAARARQKTSW